jgi:hypothetical protein
MADEVQGELPDNVLTVVGNKTSHPTECDAV